ncbi:hypothetical protein V3C99_018268 [Haemonchus contortus]
MNLFLMLTVVATLATFPRIDAATGETAPPQNPPRGLPEVPKQPISGALGVRSVKNGSGQPGATPNGQPGGPSSEGQERNPFGVGGNALVGQGGFPNGGFGGQGQNPYNGYGGQGSQNP